MVKTLLLVFATNKKGLLIKQSLLRKDYSMIAQNIEKNHSGYYMPQVAWSSLAAKLADWTTAHLVVRDDTHGFYLPDPIRCKYALSRDKLVQSYNGAGCPVGLYTTNLDDMSKTCVIDIDAHGEATTENFRLAQYISKRAVALGINPLVEHSDGNGGFKLRFLFDTLVPAAVLRSFGHWLIQDVEELFGITGIEVFPKQDGIKGRFGSYVRLPGRHHRRSWYSEFFDTKKQVWYRRDDAPGYLASFLPNAASLIPQEATIYLPPRPAPKHQPCQPGEGNLDGSWFKRFKGDLRSLQIVDLCEDINLNPEAESEDRYRIECPWKDQHSNGEHAYLFLNESGIPGFYCHHAHCEGRSIQDLLEWIGTEKVDEYCEKVYQDLDTVLAEATARLEELPPPLAQEEETMSQTQMNPTPEVSPEAPPPASKKRDDSHFFYRHAVHFVKELQNKGEVIRYHHGRHYIYTPQQHCYRECGSQDDINIRLRQWLATKNIGQSNVIVGNVLPIVNMLCNVDVVQYPRLPFYFGKPEIPIGDFIPYQNGILSLTSYLSGHNELIPHSPAWVSTLCLPYAFDPGAKCPVWLNFLGQIFEGDQERVSLLQEYFGYCLTADGSMQKALLNIGPTRAGKGTVAHILAQLVGAKNSTGFALWQLAENFGLAGLLNKLVAFIGEVNLSGHTNKSLIYERLNSIIGEDQVDVQRKHQQGFSTVLPVRFFVACNELPNLFDNSTALAERLLILNYNLSFAGREDRDLKAKLSAEIAGINSWALNGLARLRSTRRFTEPKLSVDTKRRFIRENAPKLAFLEECCIIEEHINPGNLNIETTKQELITPKGLLYNAFEKWCQENSRHTGMPEMLTKDLLTLMPKLDARCRSRREGKITHCYKGIALKQDLLTE